MDADATNDSAAASASCIQRGWVLTGGFLNLPLGIPAVEVPVPNSQESRVFVSLRTTHRGLARWASNRPLNENVLAGSATFQAIREAAWQAVLSAKSARPANAKAEGEDPAAELGLERQKKRNPSRHIFLVAYASKKSLGLQRGNPSLKPNYTPMDTKENR